METLAPGLSSADQEHVTAAVEKGLLFPLLSDQSLRGRILDRLIRMREPIYSLRTYLEETKLLQLGLSSVRLLLPPFARNERNVSIRSHFLGAHEQVTTTNMIPVQTSEDQYVLQSCPAEMVFPLKFFQLFLHGLRNFQSLTGTAPRKDRGGAKPPSIPESLESALWKLAKLAYRLGFRMQEIELLRQTSPEMSVTVDFLL